MSIFPICISIDGYLKLRGVLILEQDYIVIYSYRMHVECNFFAILLAWYFVKRTIFINVIHLAYSLTRRNFRCYLEITGSNLRKLVSVEIDRINVYNLIILTFEFRDLFVENSVTKDIVAFHKIRACNACVAGSTCNSSVLVMRITLILEENIAYCAAREMHVCCLTSPVFRVILDSQRERIECKIIAYCSNRIIHILD